VLKVAANGCKSETKYFIVFSQSGVPPIVNEYIFEHLFSFQIEAFKEDWYLLQVRAAKIRQGPRHLFLRKAMENDYVLWLNYFEGGW